MEEHVSVEPMEEPLEQEIDSALMNQTVPGQNRPRVAIENSPLPNFMWTHSRYA